ncbi:hypothetical protein QJQ45_003876 [Haematococcus lacustris]|nr:hypothetical protein QJQ45_003876 [Haematococcus lacustris]
MPDYLEKMRAIPDSMGRYMFLRKLRQDDSQKFYRLMLDHTDEVLPFIYTPTVGEACERYHTLPDLKVQGLYLTLEDKGKLLERLRSWPQTDVRVMVVTDGERILGLGDLGAGGMGISEGKITLYTAAAGLDPSQCIPVCLDVGTNNQKLLQDPSYKGLHRKRATGSEYDDFVNEFMQAVSCWQRHIIIQFEDFGNNNAFRLLERYRSQACVFNDDIQGTASITLAALLAAVKACGSTLAEQRVLFSGAGEAGTGIGELIAYCVHRRTGVSLEEGRRHCFYMDSKGLVQELQHHKLPFAHDMPHCKTLLEAVNTIRPTTIIGVSAQPNTFTEPVVRAMADFNARPFIFPLSNPTNKSECTFEEAVRWTDGRVLFASGSPFDPLLAYTHADLSSPPKHRMPFAVNTTATERAAWAIASTKRFIRPAQANNAYVFPAVGLAAVVTQASSISDEVFLLAAEALADLAIPSKASSPSCPPCAVAWPGQAADSRLSWVVKLPQLPCFAMDPCACFLKFTVASLKPLMTAPSSLASSPLLVVAQVLSEGALFPPFSHILDVSAHVAARLARYFVTSGVGVRPASVKSGPSPEDLGPWERAVRDAMWSAAKPKAAAVAQSAAAEAQGYPQQPKQPSRL